MSLQKNTTRKKEQKKQADANETLIRKLTAKMYKKDNSVKAEELKLKLKATKSKFVKQILKYKRCLKYLIIEKKD